MTLPASGYLQLGTDGATGRSINSEFGYGNDMQSYLGVFYDLGGSAAQFPLPGNSISIQNFYSSKKITPGSDSPGTGYWTVPVYNVISATVQGGQGGQAGFWGYNACSGVPTGSAGGGPGGTSSFGGYLAAGGGGGGGGSGGGGSPGATASNSWTNPIQSGSGPTSGTQIYITVGSGGSGGGGGSNCAYYPFYYGPLCICSGGSGGGSGASGYVSISWT